MDLTDQIIAASAAFKAPLELDSGTLALEFVVAERKSLFYRRKLTYRCRVKVDEAARRVRMFEILKEKGFGLSGIGDSLSGPGFGFRKETFKLSGVRLEGMIKEQAAGLGQGFKFNWDYAAVRREVERLARDNGYTFELSLSEKNL